MLNKLLNPQSSVKKRKRIGRGPGSGLGKTSGKGHKGQKARSGYNTKFGFEGGQTPLHRRLPKKGFKNIHSKTVNAINICQIVAAKNIDLKNPVDYQVLKDNGLIKYRNSPVKLLSRGEFEHAVELRVDAASKVALEKIEKVGGRVIIQ